MKDIKSMPCPVIDELTKQDVLNNRSNVKPFCDIDLTEVAE